MILALALPAALLVALAIAVPRLLERRVPETLVGLVLLGGLSALALWWLSALGFLLLYRWQGAGLDTLLGAPQGALFRHFLGLGLKAALIWAPVLVLAVSTAPRRWRQATW